MRWRALGSAAVAGALLYGCGAQTPVSATSSWARSSSFAQGVTSLLDDYAKVSGAISRHASSATVRTYCAEMFTNANGENTDMLPSPDAQLTTLLSTAFDEFVQATARCMGDPGSAAVRQAVVRESGRAVGGLVSAVLREEAVTGRSAGVTGIR